MTSLYNPSRKFTEEQASAAENFLSENSHKLNIFCGDWNLNLKNPTEPNVARYINAFSPYGYQHVIDKYTRINTLRPLTATLVDHIAANFNNYFIDSGILITDFSDHFPVFAIFSNLATVFKMQPNRKIRDYKHFDISGFLYLLASQSWDLTHLTPDDSLSKIQNVITTSLDLLAPFKALSRKDSKRKPWISNDLIHEIAIKRKLYLKYLNTGRLTDKLKYRQFSNSLGKKIFAIKKAYFANKIVEAGSNMRYVWSAIKEMLNTKRSGSCPKLIKIPNGNETSDDTEIANTLNEFFTSVGRELASKFPPASSVFKDYLCAPCCNSCVFMPIDETEVFNIISSINSKTSAGYDGISSRVLKIASPIISGPLAVLFNKCLATGSYPNGLKIAKVVPIFKKGDPTEPGNYRPISVLPLLNKVFEKLIHSRLISFFNSNGIFNQNQFGFRKNHSTSHALMEMSDDLQILSDKGFVSCSIYVDLKKAFDTVDHQILLSKLHHYGVRGKFHELLSSYLSNRLQYTVINGVSSEHLKVTCGVPQGSVLGPLFFNIFVNDIFKSSKRAKIILFADDTNIRYAADNLESLESIVNTDLCQIFKWFSANKLTVSLEKTNYMIITPPRSPYYDSFSIIQNKIQLTRVSSVRYLGVYIDKRLKWTDHISHIIEKINKNVGILWKTSYFLSFQHRKMLYNSLIFPSLHYCCEVWGAGPPSKLRCLLAAQNRCLKIISFAPRFASPKPLYSLYNILDIYKMVYQSICVFMHSIKLRRAPYSLCSKFSLLHESHRYSTRLAQYGFFAKRFASIRGKYCISTLGPKLYNLLPDTVANSASISVFKSSLMTYLLQQELDSIIELFK